MTENSIDKTEEQITFTNSKAQEVIRFAENGDIFVRGKLIDNDIEVVQALRDFLVEHGYLKEEAANEN